MEIFIRRNKDKNTYNIDVMGHSDLPTICSAFSTAMAIFEKQIQELFEPNMFSITNNSETASKNIMVNPTGESKRVYDFMNFCAEVIKAIHEQAVALGRKSNLYEYRMGDNGALCEIKGEEKNDGQEVQV